MSANRFDLSGKTILVTGASSGLGAHFAAMLAGEGAGLVLAARRVARLEALAAEIVAAGGREPAIIAMDVADEASVAAGFATLADRGIKLDVVVNNAGIAHAARRSICRRQRSIR